MRRLKLTIQAYIDSERRVKYFSCSECGKLFVNRDELNRHNENVHARNKTSQNVVITQPHELVGFVCELCERSFPNQVRMSNHKLFMHTVKTNNMKCDYCGNICD